MSEAITIVVQGILFDMDGVLVSSIGSVNRCWRRWARHYEVAGAEAFEVPHGVRATDIIRSLRPDIDPAEGLRLIEDMEIEDVADLHVLPGVPALLASIPAARWAIVTSATRRLLEGRLRAGGLPVPTRLISAEGVERGKPDPEPYLRGAALLGFRADACLVIEDAPSGVRAGSGAGCDVLAVTTSHGADELSIAGARWVVASLENVRVQSTGAGLQVHFPAL